MADERKVGQGETPSEARRDAELLAAARDGETGPFGELVARHQDRLYNLAFRLTGNADEASDLTQEAFLKAWRGLRTFRGESSFYTWIFRIAVNEARSRRRYSAVRPTPVSLDAAEGRATPETRPGRAEDPADEAGRMERKEIVQRAMTRLDPDQRMMIVLRDIEGRDYEEIADLLDCPRGTVKSRLHRARMALKELLAPALGGQGNG